MFNFRLKSMLLALGLGMFTCGCGEQKKPMTGAPPLVHSSPNSLSGPVATESKEKPPEKLELTATPPDIPVSPTIPAAMEKPADPKPKTTEQAEAKAPRQVRTFTEAEFLPDDVVGLLVVHPKQFFDSPIGKLLKDLGFDKDSGEPAEMLRRLNLKLDEIDQVTIVIDQPLVNTMARQSGLAVAVAEAGGVAAPAGEKNWLKNSLKQFGLGFHNYHDVFSKFPRADGDGSGQHTGLSWRVHLLPYLDQAPLYNQFHFDEPWDSEHNKTLIELMPPIFQSPGVTDAGKTSFHVFTGEKTMFHGEEGIGIRNITDGTSNTILAVLAGADTADFWTKPGGLDVDLTAPKKALGEIEGDTVPVLMADGAVREMPTNIDETTLANLIQPSDGNVVDFGDHGRDTPGGARPPSISLPPAIVVLTNDVSKDDVLKGLLRESTEETHEGQTFHKNETTAIWFPNGKTIVTGPIETVKKMIAAKQKQSGKEGDSPLISQLRLDADYSLAVDMQSQASLVAQFAQQNPMMGMISNIKTVAMELSANEKEGDSLMEINVTALDAGMANGLSAIATMGLNQGKMTMAQFPEAPNANANDKEMQKLIKQVVASATVKQDGDKIQFRIPTPQGFNRVPVLLKPALLEARVAAQRAQQMNYFRMIGLAFHNFHDTYSSFPGAGRIKSDQPIGLSWRVHLLPFLDQAPLYNQFHRDEPWDSEHNKTLIEKMPPIFKSPGVDEAGKTTIHLFTGPGAPFADDAAPGIREFTDGTSNTILAVVAGPDTAEIWTKPGGLDFDPEDPIKSLGNIIGDTFVALIADGSVRTISKSIDAQLLRRLIQFSDGEPINAF